VEEHFISHNALSLLTFFELQVRKLLFLTFQFNFLWSVANSTPMNTKWVNLTKPWNVEYQQAGLFCILFHQQAQRMYWHWEEDGKKVWETQHEDNSTNKKVEHSAVNSINRN